MKLPNFFDFEILNILKSRMGIPRGELGNLTVAVSPGRLTLRELELLGSSEGLDVDFDDIQILPDGTLAYKGTRVLLYIRDVSVYVRRQNEHPKFHLANCRTLIQMRGIQRFDRYVVATKEDGRFSINWIERGRPVKKDTVQLDVCQNCLDMLSFSGFHLDMSRQERRQRVSAFRIGDFFAKYPKSLHIERPRYGEADGPLNAYSDDFTVTSQRTRSEADWVCERCGVDLSDRDHRKYLQTHHRNGLKFDNSKQNLEALCLLCHADEPAHQHMRNLPEHALFKQLHPRLHRRR